MKYEILKKEIIKNIYHFDLTNDLFYLTNAIILAKTILAENGDLELLEILEQNGSL